MHAHAHTQHTCVYHIMCINHVYHHTMNRTSTSLPQDKCTNPCAYFLGVWVVVSVYYIDTNLSPMGALTHLTTYLHCHIAPEKKNQIHDMLVFPQYVTTLNNGASLSNQVPTQSNKIHLAQECLEKSLLLPKNKISILESCQI